MDPSFDPLTAMDGLIVHGPSICREAGQERGPHREGAAQRQEEAA